MPVLGVVGSMVWDTIRLAGQRPGDAVHGWGGIAHSLAAVDAALPGGWTALPIIKVGEDLRARADDFFRGLTRLESIAAVATVPEPNNRVELVYYDRGNRRETLTGGVSGFEADEALDAARGCDALYVNFISGWELDLAAASVLKSAVGGLVYSDLHSLLLGVEPGGGRVMRPVPRPRAWMRCFDVVQMNESELATLAHDRSDPWKFAQETAGGGTAAVIVTRGESGATWFSSGRLAEGNENGGRGVSGPVTTGSVGADLGSGGGRYGRGRGPEELDPTGCGDVWGATCCARLLAGESLESAAKAAARASGIAARVRGTRGLRAALEHEAR